MASLLDMVQQHLGPQEIARISEQLGTDPATAQRAISAALPMIVGGLASNASQPAGADAIHNAPGSQGGLLGNLGSLLGTGGPADGGGLLGRVLGGQQAPVQDGVAKASGLDQEKVMNLLMMLAPIVMSVLAKRRQEQPDRGPVADDLRRESERAQQQAPQLGGLLGQIFKGL